MVTTMKYLYMLLIVFMSLTMSIAQHNGAVIDPENEHYYHVFVGFKSNNVVFGINHHQVIDENIYINTKLTIYPSHLLSKSKKEYIYTLSTGIQAGSLGYERLWNTKKNAQKHIIC